MDARRIANRTLEMALADASRADLAPVFRLAYVSEASDLMSPGEMRAIAERSGPRNSALDVTGILVMNGGHILQVLEGARPTVTALFEKIARDPRHTGVRQVAGSEQDERLLNNWSMVAGDGGVVPPSLLEAFQELYARLASADGLIEVGEDEIDLLKTISLFRSIPLS